MRDDPRSAGLKHFPLSTFDFRLSTSPAEATGADGPDRLDLPAPHAYQVVVEIDRRVAVAGNELELVAQRDARVGRELEHAVLVGRPGVLGAFDLPHARHARVHARR